MRPVRKYAALIGYLFLLFVVVAALQWHHMRTTGDLDEASRRSCQALRQATDNQREVLATLISMNEEQLASPYLREGAKRRLPGLRRAFVSVPSVICED